MKVIGIVGGMGAGKSTVIALLDKMQPVSYISADKIGHDILLKGHEAYAQIVETFGTAILDDNGEIIRKKLGEIVFQDPRKVQTLNEITHPIITKIIKDQIKNYKEISPGRHIILEAALLLESGLVDLTDVVVAVYADKDVRLKRVINREGLPKKQIIERFNAQKAWEELKVAADYIIDNSTSIENTQMQIKELLIALSEKGGE